MSTAQRVWLIVRVDDYFNGGTGDQEVVAVAYSEEIARKLTKYTNTGVEPPEAYGYRSAERGRSMEEDIDAVEVSVVEHREDPDPWKRYSILSKPSYTRCHCNTRTDADIIAEALRRYERFMIDHPYEGDDDE